MSRARLIACVLLPFAAGYYLSYLFRTINALIAGDLTAELDLSAADLGFLTSVYFLVFAAVQLPFGALLDRYGPRTIQSALLLLASAGALVFALADGLLGLVIGRALIGSRRRLGADGRLQGHRAVVSAGAHCPRQRLAGDAGRARCRDGDGTCRARRAGASAGAACSLCWLACRRWRRCWFCSRCPSRPAARATRDSAAGGSAFGRSTGIDASGALRRSPPSASARPGRCKACGPHPGCATSTASIAPPSSSISSVMAIAVCVSAPASRHGGGSASSLGRQNGAGAGIDADAVHGGPGGIGVALAGAVVSALGGHRCGRRRDRSELRDPGRVLSRRKCPAAPTRPSTCCTSVAPSSCSRRPASSSSSGPRRAAAIPPKRIRRPWPPVSSCSWPRSLGSRCRREASRRRRCRAWSRVRPRAAGHSRASASTRYATGLWSEQSRTGHQATGWRFAATASAALCVALATALASTIGHANLAAHIVEVDRPIVSADSSILRDAMAATTAEAAIPSGLALLREVPAQRTAHRSGVHLTAYGLRASSPAEFARIGHAPEPRLLKRTERQR